MSEKKKVTLKFNTDFTKCRCRFYGCPNMCDPTGFDFYSVDGAPDIVCRECAEKYAPELLPIQEDALIYGEFIADQVRKQIAGVAA